MEGERERESMSFIICNQIRTTLSILYFKIPQGIIVRDDSNFIRLCHQYHMSIIDCHVADKMEIMVYTKPKLYEKFGHLFYNVTEMQVNFTMEGLQLHLGNLFNGITLLGELISITSDIIQLTWFNNNKFY